MLLFLNVLGLFQGHSPTILLAHPLFRIFILLPSWLHGLLSLAEAVRWISPISLSARTDFETVSGLSAAHTVYLAGGNVLLLDKNSKVADSCAPESRTLISHPRLLRRELDESHVGHKWCSHENTSRREDRG